MNKTARNRFLLIHGGLLGGVLLFPLYQRLMGLISPLLTGCFFHERLFLYCPFCGGTRAVGALLRLQLVQAWQFNPIVTIGVFAFLFLDLLALIRLLRGKTRLYPVPTWGWILVVAMILVYGVLRNYLMLRWGYDPTGDLVQFWWK